MKFSTSSVGGCEVAHIAGVVDKQVAGELSDALVACVRKGRGRLIVDLSQVPVMTRAGTRGLVVAAKLLESAGGRMRICGANASVHSVVGGLGFNHLLKLDPTVAVSLAALLSDLPDDADWRPKTAYVSAMPFPVKAPATSKSAPALTNAAA